MIVGNADITAVERLHYLKGHVTGEASRLLAHIPITADNFDRAWNALIARYENKRVLLAAYFDRLTELESLTSKSADALKLVLATTCEVIGGLDALDISPADAWNMFLVYFVARRLDHETLEAWELQLGNATEPASFPQLKNFLEGRIRALELSGPTLSARSKQGAPKPASVNARTKAPARVHIATTKTTKCSCCRAAHFIASCPDFARKSPADRYDFARSRRLCYNCLGEHLLADCRTTKCC